MTLRVESRSRLKIVTKTNRHRQKQRQQTKRTKEMEKKNGTQARGKNDDFWLDEFPDCSQCCCSQERNIVTLSHITCALLTNRSSIRITIGIFFFPQRGRKEPEDGTSQESFSNLPSSLVPAPSLFFFSFSPWPRSLPIFVPPPQPMKAKLSVITATKNEPRGTSKMAQHKKRSAICLFP